MNRILAAHKALGVVFVVLAVVSVYLVYAVFTQKFTDYERVTLQTSKIGLQLPQRADVKIRGVIIGEVLDFEPTSDGAELTLGLFPDRIDSMDIPDNVTGSIVPKTLFGEKEVSLELPADPSDTQLAAGSTITRTTVSTEVEEVLSDLYPLLRAVQPADLNMTLNAIATALEGRGDQLGDSLVTLDGYLKKINPEIPLLVEDLRLTADVSDIYRDVLPEVADILDNTVLTTGTLEDREERLNALFTDLTMFSDTARTFLDANGDNLIRAADQGSQIFRLLAKYAPQTPCLTQGITRAGVLQAEAFRGFKLHIVLETLPRQPRKYDVGDLPRIGDDRGPNCINLPNPPGNQANPYRNVPDFDDGVDRPTGKGTQRVAPGFESYGADPLGYDGSPEDQAVLRQMLAEWGDADSDLGTMLAGPLVATGGTR